MTFGELLRLEASPDSPYSLWEVKRLTHDSRTATPDTLFFCLVGARHDGHTFAEQAFRRGCRFFVAERPLALPHSASVLLVPNARRCMARLSSRFYGDPASDMTVIGITGTKGKTTTAKMTAQLLTSLSVPTAYIGSSGAILGDEHYDTVNTTPDSPKLFSFLAKAKSKGIRTVALEVSSQALTQERVHGLPFRIGIFTNLTRDHIGVGEHKSMGEYRRAKLSFFTEHRPNTVILNGEDRFSYTVLRHLREQKPIFFGKCRASSLLAEQLTPLREGERFSTALTLVKDGARYETSIPFAGKHYVDDLLAALLATCELTGLDVATLLPYLGSLRAEGRCEVMRAGSGAAFVIDYAHNGASLAAALMGLRPYTEGRLYCLFGAVGERSACRRRDMARAACRYADFSVITEDNPGNEDPEGITSAILSAFPDKRRAVVIPDRREAIEYLLRVATPRDVVLLAGKGDERFQVRGGDRIPFSEAEILGHYSAIVSP